MSRAHHCFRFMVWLTLRTGATLSQLAIAGFGSGTLIPPPRMERYMYKYIHIIQQTQNTRSLTQCPPPQLNRSHPLKGRSAILNDLQDNCFVAVSCGRGPLSRNTYSLTKTGKVCLFDEHRVLDRFTEVKVRQRMQYYVHVVIEAYNLFVYMYSRTSE